MMAGKSKSCDESSTAIPEVTVAASDFYSKAEEYWDTVDADINGMLGGYEHLHDLDIKDSCRFLDNFVKGAGKINTHRVLECGAGIGRVTKGLLLKYFKEVDISDVSEKFLKQAKVNLENDSSRVGQILCSRIQDLEPEDGRYNAIWSQWVLGHIQDDDLVRFFVRCRESLSRGGMIFVKDNVASRRTFDDVDSSFTRTDKEFKEIFHKAGLCLIKEATQIGFPSKMFKVKMYALKGSRLNRTL